MAIGSIQAAGYANMTCVNFLLNPVEQPMLIHENKRLGKINNPPSNNNILITASVSSEVPSAFIKLLSLFKKKRPINSPFVTIDIITAKNARKNLHLEIPFRAPSLCNTEKGPPWRNFVIPKDPVMIDMA